MMEDDALGLLIRHELAIMGLYEILAALFEDRGDFWRNLAADERRHADMLSGLRQHAAGVMTLLQNGQVRPQAIRTSIGHVEQQAARAKEGNLSLIQALSIARDLENALLERQFSRMQSPATEELRSVLASLTEETRRHLKAVVEMLAAERTAYGRRQ